MINIIKNYIKQRENKEKKIINSIKHQNKNISPLKLDKSKRITDNFDSMFQNEIENVLESDVVVHRIMMMRRKH